MAGVDHDEIRLAARREPADVVAPQRPRAACGGRLEDVAGGEIGHRFTDDARAESDHAHLVEHVVGIGVGPDPEVDPGPPVAAEGAQRDPAPSEHGGAVGDGRAGLGDAGEVLARGPVQPRVMVEKDCMAEDRVLAERAHVGQEADRGPAVAPLHLVELGDALGDVGLERQVALDRVVVGVAQGVGAAGVDLAGIDHAAEPAAGMLGGEVDDGAGARERLSPGRVVPLVLERVSIAREPSRIPESGGHHGADAAVGQGVEPFVIGRGEIGDRRASAQ